MDIKFINQPKEQKMGEVLKKRLEENFDEVWIVSGIVKDTGLEYLKESIESAIKNKTEVNMLIGVDRKNTSKDALINLISIGANLSIHVNTEDEKVESRIYAFISNKKESYVYLFGGKLSEGGLTENNSIITEIKYQKDEQEALRVFKTQLISGTSSIFKNVDKEDILLLAKNGEILTRIIDRKIPSIKELYGNKEQIIGEQTYDESSNLKIFDIDDLENIDIEFEDGIELRKNVELQVEKDAKEEIIEIKKSENDLKRLLGKEEKEVENPKAKIIKNIKEIDSKNISAIIIEAGKIATDGAEAGKIRIPKLLATKLYNFLEISESEEKSIAVELIDNKDSKSIKTSANINSNSKGISLYIEEIKKLDINEIDILRIIKEDTYKIEIIRKDTNEYAIWEKYCTNSVRGTSRRYALI